MDTKKFKDFAVPFILTVSAVIVGLAIYDYARIKKAKRETEKAATT